MLTIKSLMHAHADSSRKRRPFSHRGKEAMKKARVHDRCSENSRSSRNRGSSDEHDSDEHDSSSTEDEIEALWPLQVLSKAKAKATSLFAKKGRR
jgi:hypothetical protein